MTWAFRKEFIVHEPVLLRETIKYLINNTHGIYIDCTVGGGGHLSALIENLEPGARIIALDKDAGTLEKTRQKFLPHNITFVHADFRNLRRVLQEQNTPLVDGIMLDLGVSSFQLDEQERGFSYHNDAHLDMRMDRNQTLTAWHIVNEWSEERIKKLIREYGEENFAAGIARAITRARNKSRINTTMELVNIIKAAVPARYRRDKHPARRTFQALRIAVNNELEAIEQVLPQALGVLKSGGRLCVITFHSLEDRVVKQFFLDKSRTCICPPNLPICVCQHQAELQVLTRKPITPDNEEIERNPRARSAKLRVASKI